MVVLHITLLVVMSINIIIISNISFLEKILEYNSKLNPDDDNINNRPYDITRREKNYNYSPIEFAIKFGNVECVEILLKYNSPIDMIYEDRFSNHNTVNLLIFRF